MGLGPYTGRDEVSAGRTALTQSPSTLLPCGSFSLLQCKATVPLPHSPHHCPHRVPLDPSDYRTSVHYYRTKATATVLTPSPSTRGPSGAVDGASWRPPTAAVASAGRTGRCTGNADGGPTGGPCGRLNGILLKFWQATFPRVAHYVR